MAESVRDSILTMMIAFGRVVVSLAVMAWIGFLGLWLRYSDTRPTLELPAQGRLYPLNTHGHIVYLTRHELQIWRLLGVGAVVLVVVAGAIQFMAKKRQRRQERSSRHDIS